ncbi:hypothetical protein CR513_16398, partial [Mucuna pruriens]
MRYEPSRHDEPMVISIEVAEYKVERVLIDQGSLANIFYWSTYKKLGLQLAEMESYAEKLHGFAREQVEIRGGIKLETMFGERSYTRTILVLYGVEASYNVIIGRLALNKLGAVVFSYHLCMKYLVGKEVGRVWADHRVARRCYEDCLRIGLQPAKADRPDVNVLDLNLNPRCKDECERTLSIEDLKEINIGTSPTHKTKIGTTLTQEEERNLVSFLQEN